MTFYDPSDIVMFNEPQPPLVPDATIRANDATIYPNTPSPSLVSQVMQQVEKEAGKGELSRLAKLEGNKWVRGGVPLATMIGAPLVGQAIGGSAGEHVAGAIGGAGTGFGLGSMLAGTALGAKAGPYGALAGALLGGTGIGQKIPVVGPLLFGGAGGAQAEQLSPDDFEAYGAGPSEVHRLFAVADKIEQVESKEAAQAYLQDQLATYRSTMIAGQQGGGSPLDQTKNDALLAQVIGKTMLPYRDEAIRNITAAQQSAMKSGLPEVANQYFEMSKATANAYAQQAIMFGPTSRMQQTLQDQINATAAAGSGSSAGLFGQISPLGNQAAG